MSNVSTSGKPLTEQEIQDEALIQAAFQHLLDTYLATNHRKKVEIITKAFNFAKAAHKGVRRKSGEPYILHPIAVAQIVCEEIGMGSTCICAALLHDVVEDTDYTYEDIATLFGTKVANIVEGVTKVSGGIFGDRASMQAETFKKILLTMSDDVRVVLVKISDRLHNMRTLQSMPKGKQYKIVGETLYIFAPLADRLGLNRIKTELEDLSFKYEHTEEYEEVMHNLQASQMERDDIFSAFTPAIRDRLDAMGWNYTIKARVKSPYSIWKKMQKKHISFQEVFDILAIRIVFTPKDRSHEIEECHQLYAALTTIYTPHPTRYRDWLATPKANGYQALHNTFMSKQGQWIEIQIRTDRMDDIAEQGFAAHWKYKEEMPTPALGETELDRWLGSIREILDDPQPDTLDLLDTIKLNLYASEINVFTPKGEIKSMPAGATVLDFAFSVHSFIGSHCMGAKVNHRLVPLSYHLNSGDQIEILTSNSQHVKEEWLQFVTTAKARGKISAILRREARQIQRKGEEALREFLQAHDVEASTGNIDKLVALHHFATPAELFQAYGSDNFSVSAHDIDYLLGRVAAKKKNWTRFVPFFSSGKSESHMQAIDPETEDFVKSINRKKTLILTDEIIAKCDFPDCCHPIPGDEVLGYITPDNRLEIHKRQCEAALKLKTSYGNNIIATKWETHKAQLFDTTIHIRGVDDHGVLHSIADVLEGIEQCIVKGIAISTEDGIFDGQMLVAVHDTEEVQHLCVQLRKIKNVNFAARIN